MAFTPITQFDFPNTLAYDSDLRELLKIVKELYDNYKTMYNAYLELMDEFAEIKAQFDEFQKVIDRLPETIRAEVQSQLDTALVEVYNYLDTQLATLRAEIAAFREYINNLADVLNDKIDAVQSDLDTKDEAQTYANYKLRAELLAKIDEIQRDIDALQWKLPEVYDISTGTRQPLVAALYNEYDALRVHTLTAGRRDCLGFTAKKQDGLLYTAYEWDVISGHLQNYGKICPLDGMVQPTIRMIVEMALHLYDDTIEAGVYDDDSKLVASPLTAKTYEDLAISAYTYDFHSLSELTAEREHTYKAVYSAIDSAADMSEAQYNDNLSEINSLKTRVKALEDKLS